MRNILLALASEKHFNHKIISKVIETAKPDNTYIIVAEKSDLHFYEDIATCYFREDIVKGAYSSEKLDISVCTPLDDTIFAYMNPHSMEIMNQQRRFEEYHPFHIPFSLASHYTIYMHNLFFWYNMLLNNQITHIFLSSVPHEGYDSIIYYLAKMMNIPLQMIYNSIFPGREYLLKDWLAENKSLREEFAKLKKEYSDTNIEDIPLDIENERMYQKWSSLDPVQMTPLPTNEDMIVSRFRKRFGVTNVVESWRGILGAIYAEEGFTGTFLGKSILSIPKLCVATVDTMRRRHYARPAWKRTVKLTRFYESIAEEPLPNEKYVYFALHYQPEASSSPLGGDVYMDQMFAINILSKHLPEDIKIYVKVHPEQLAPLRSKEYYLDMKRIPKVRFMKRGCSTYALIKNAFAVSTLTGTASWEAQFFGKPALLFGYSIRNLAPLSYAIRTNEDCKEAISKLLNDPKKTTNKELKLFTKALYNNSYPVRELDTILPKIIINFLEGNEMDITMWTN